MILITGATGHLGSAVVDHLLKESSLDNFIALARTEEKAKPIRDKGIQVRIGDFDDLASLEQAFDGIDKLLLISTISHNRAAQQIAVIDKAKKAGVKHIAYTGVAMVDVNTAATKALMDSHFQTEDYIKESGLTYTFLRNTLYSNMIPMYVGDNVFKTGIYLPAGNGKAPFALRREMGEAAANVLLQNDHENKIYNITGSNLYSFADVAEALSGLSGKLVDYVDADPKEYVDRMKQLGVNEMMISMVSGFATDIKNHQCEIVTNDLEKILGRRPAALKEALKEVYNF